MIKDYYQELHIHSKAVPEVINSSYKILKEKYQRDIHPDELESWMSSLEEAYAVLSDPEKRKKYDQVYFQEFGGVAELERRLNRHKGLLMTLSAVFMALLILAVYFLYSIKKPLEPKGPIVRQIAELKDDMTAFKMDKGDYPSVASADALRKELKSYRDERKEIFWSKVVKYELTSTGKYRITFDAGDSTILITETSSQSQYK